MYTYRLETPDDWARVEALTREAFWNVYKPGCDEHYIVHSLRGSSAVLPGLNYVCEEEGRLCGHIFWTQSLVEAPDGRTAPVLTFGPVSILPACQGRGIGSALIRMTLEKARTLDYPGAVITGSPRYYRRFGFRDAASWGIVFEDGSSFPELMALEFGPRRLDAVRGRVRFCPEFSAVDPEALLDFDRQFPAREKLRLPGQLG